MTENVWNQMNEQQRHLVVQSMREMDRHYNDEIKMIREGALHSTRGSGHYAFGLLLRGEPGDRERACEVIDAVLALQFNHPGEIYHGTFRAAPELPVPPAGHMAWITFPPGFAYSILQTMEDIYDKFVARLAEQHPHALEGLEPASMKRVYREAVNQTLPPVWESYDPNWREFIACTFALILDHYESVLPDDLVRRMDQAMHITVEASIDRRISISIPMNTNIELMHLFITHYFGYRYHTSAWMEHAEREAQLLLQEFEEFDSFAEFNSTTYYGVDLTVLGMWRKYGQSKSFREVGRVIEQGLWRNIALFYHPSMEEMSGPFARAYEMEMRAHSSMGVFIYLALGEGYEHLAGLNCESSHDPLIAAVGVEVPADVFPQLREHHGDRLVRKQFRELCERDKPGENSHLCTATAWIGERLMLGGMAGSRNTNGQMHPATIHWQTTDGEKYFVRLLRRAVGDRWNTHLRGIYYEAHAEKNRLEIEVRLETKEELELFFEFSGGPGLREASITGERWGLPGLNCMLEAEVGPAPAPTLRKLEDRLELVYAYRPGAEASGRMRFVIHLCRA